MLAVLFNFQCFSIFFPGHQISMLGHQKIKYDGFGGPNGPPPKKVSVEPCLLCLFCYKSVLNNININLMNTNQDEKI